MHYHCYGYLLTSVIGPLNYLINSNRTGNLLAHKHRAIFVYNLLLILNIKSHLLLFKNQHRTKNYNNKYYYMPFDSKGTCPITMVSHNCTFAYYILYTTIRYIHSNIDCNILQYIVCIHTIIKFCLILKQDVKGTLNKGARRDGHLCFSRWTRII